MIEHIVWAAAACYIATLTAIWLIRTSAKAVRLQVQEAAAKLDKDEVRTAVRESLGEALQKHFKREENQGVYR